MSFIRHSGRCVFSIGIFFISHALTVVSSHHGRLWAGGSICGQGRFPQMASRTDPELLPESGRRSLHAWGPSGADIRDRCLNAVPKNTLILRTAVTRHHPRALSNTRVPCTSPLRRFVAIRFRTTPHILHLYTRTIKIGAFHSSILIMHRIITVICLSGFTMLQSCDVLGNCIAMHWPHWPLSSSTTKGLLWAYAWRTYHSASRLSLGCRHDNVD